MNNLIITQEKPAGPQVLIVLLLPRLPIVIRHIESWIIRIPNPHRTLRVIQEPDILVIFVDNPATLIKVNLVDPNEVVVIPVLVKLESELTVEQVFGNVGDVFIPVANLFLELNLFDAVAKVIVANARRESV